MDKSPQALRASVPIPKFAIVAAGKSCELRIREHVPILAESERALDSSLQDRVAAIGDAVNVADCAPA